jgi:hypothetical protein
MGSAEFICHPGRKACGTDIGEDFFSLQGGNCHILAAAGTAALAADPVVSAGPVVKFFENRLVNGIFHGKSFLLSGNES